MMIAVGIRLVQREPSAKLFINPLIHGISFAEVGMGVALDYYPVHAHKYRCTSYVNIMIYNVYIYMCTWVILFLYDFFIIHIQLYTHDYMHTYHTY